jgi:large subunit ribosomal protein L15
MQANEYQGLHNLVAPIGARKNRKRLGRGEGSGHGKTSGKGHKGQKARKSGQVRIGFEGGQNPMDRRLPKRGFSNAPFKRDVQAVNLNRIAERFTDGSVVDRQSLIAVGLISAGTKAVKILGTGDLSIAITLRIHAASKSAIDKVLEKGGAVEIIGKE